MLSGHKITKRLFTGLLFGALCVAAVPAGAVDYHLAAKQFNMTMPDGTIVPMWGYVANPGGSCYNAANNAARLACVNALPAPTVPGPRLTLAPNEVNNQLRIFLSNGLPRPTSIVIPGQKMPFSATNNGPTWNNGIVGARPNATQRVRSFGREAGANGGRQTYVWNTANVNPLQLGTYTYHSGTHPQVQVQMGLYGAVSRDADAGAAYTGVSYNTAHDLFYSEVDPALHAAVAGGTYGTLPGPTSTLNYQPKYFLLQTYNSSGLPVDVSIDPANKTCINGGMVGDRVLLRMYNAGLRDLAPMMIGSHFDIVAEGGKKYPFAQSQYQVLLMPGSTRDVIFTPDYDGSFPLIERRLNLTDAAQMNGGMQTCLTVAAAGTPFDLIFADSFETGTFVAWTAEQDGEGDLNVTAAAALVGASGMAALIDNTTGMWVRSDTPANETRYRARFYFDPNSIAMVNGDLHRIMVTRPLDGTVGSIDVTRIEFGRNSGLYQVRARAALDAGTFVTTPWFTINDESTHIEIDWQAATAPGANNGSLSLWTNGALVSTLSGLDNDLLRVQSVRLGPSQGIDAGTAGTLYFDAFVSRRTTYIGP